MPTITITLSESGSGDSVTIPAPSLNVPAPLNIPSVTLRGSGGGIVRYQYGLEFHEVIAGIEGMSDTIKDELEVFLLAHWRDDITYTDENTRTFTVNCLDSQFRFQKQFKNFWSVSIRFAFPSILK